MQRAHYDEKFEDFGPRISSDSSMMSPSYSSYSSEACYTKDPFANIQPMAGPNYQSLLCSPRSIEEVVQSTIWYISDSLMVQFKKTKAGRWTGMIFIPMLHIIYCLSFHLKHEGMNYIADHFKISRIIGVTNMIMKKISNALVHLKKCLSKCRDMLWLTYEDLWGPTLRIASQV